MILFKITKMKGQSLSATMLLKFVSLYEVNCLKCVSWTLFCEIIGNNRVYCWPSSLLLKESSWVNCFLGCQTQTMAVTLVQCFKCPPSGVSAKCFADPLAVFGQEEWQEEVGEDQEDGTQVTILTLDTQDMVMVIVDTCLACGKQKNFPSLLTKPFMLLTQWLGSNYQYPGSYGSSYSGYNAAGSNAGYNTAGSYYGSGYGYPYSYSPSGWYNTQSTGYNSGYNSGSWSSKDQQQQLQATRKGREYQTNKNPIQQQPIPLSPSQYNKYNPSTTTSTSLSKTQHGNEIVQQQLTPY